jgi:sugar/nucleoside kinase (ribokinase family)
VGALRRHQPGARAAGRQAGGAGRAAQALKGVRISYDPNFRLLMDARYDATLRRMTELADVVKVSEEDLEGLFRTKDIASAFADAAQLEPCCHLPVHQRRRRRRAASANSHGHCPRRRSTWSTPWARAMPASQRWRGA